MARCSSVSMSKGRRRIRGTPSFFIFANPQRINYYAAHDILFPTVHTGAPTGD